MQVAEEFKVQWCVIMDISVHKTWLYEHAYMN